MAYTLTVEEQRQRLGPVDEELIRLQLSVSPGQRICNMLTMQEMVLNMWQARLRKAHPELSDLELCQLMFKRLKRNG